jgi:hypothetical protein
LNADQYPASPDSAGIPDEETLMPKRNSQKPLKTAMDFNEALERIAPTDSKDPQQEIVTDAHDQRVHLVQRGEGGPPLLMYMTDRGVNVELRVEANSFWASQEQMAEMFGIKQNTVSEHISRIFAEGELSDTEATHRKIRLVRNEGGRKVERALDHYDLNMLISIGYRAGGKLGTMFRIWATDKLFRYLAKGFVIDVERLQNRGEPDALDEFRDIARKIRTSIRNSYREVLNLCTLCADYDGSSQAARNFFMAMENKLLWAAANKTAPQLVLERADAEVESMGLTYYAGKRGPTQRDAVIGNNYLAQGEAERKNRITEMWLTYVEEQLDQGRLPTMAAVRDKLDGFIRFNQWRLLLDKGHHKREDANAHALEQLELYQLRMQAEIEAGTSKKPKRKS